MLRRVTPKGHVCSGGWRAQAQGTEVDEQTSDGWSLSTHHSLLTREMEGVGRREEVPQNPRPGKTDHGQLRVICLGVDCGEDTAESSRLVVLKPKPAHKYLRDLVKMQILIGWV